MMSLMHEFPTLPTHTAPAGAFDCVQAGACDVLEDSTWLMLKLATLLMHEVSMLHVLGRARRCPLTRS